MPNHFAGEVFCSITSHFQMYSRLRFSLFCIFALSDSVLQAASISWGFATNIATALDVSTNGELVEAYNLGGSMNATNQTINGVFFIGTSTLLSSNFSGDRFSGDTGDTAYNEMLSSFDFGGGTGTVMLSIGGGLLTIGTLYEAQVWYVDSSNLNRITPIGDGNGNQVALSAVGQYAIGTFTADDTSQVLTLQSPGFGNAHFTAYQLREAVSIPTATLSTVSNPVSAAFTVDVVFSESVVGLEEADFNVINGSVNNSSLIGSGMNYTIEISPAGNGDVSVTLNENSVIDIDGDNNQNSISNLLVTTYIAPGSEKPSVILSTVQATVEGAFTVAIDFDEAVTGLALADFAVENGNLSNLLGSGAVYSVFVTPTKEGAVNLVLPENSVTDIDGDDLMNTVSNALVTTYNLPTIPSVTIYGPLFTDQSIYKLYLTFSEPVIGLDASDFVVVNGTVYSVSGSGRYYSVTITPAAPVVVAVTLPAGSVMDLDGDSVVNTISNTYSTRCTTDFGEVWTVDDAVSWTAATSNSMGLAFAEGFAEPTADSAEFSSKLKTFSVKKKATSLIVRQSPVWDNWIAIANVQPSDAGDAPVLVPVGPDDYYLLAHKSGVYNAWHSTDMVNWIFKGPVTSGVEGRWTTSAEYKDGDFYIYSDYFNDHTPHLFIDDDLGDGVPGTHMGAVFVKEASGSDCSLFRNNDDGLFHLIYEDWSPINARTHSWDSPLAGHTSSPDGINGFIENKHQPVVDLRTTPTGTFGTYNHPNVSNETYEIHTPAQDAFGDWTTVKIGSRFYLFGDFDPHGQGIKLARFTSESIYEEFELIGSMHQGHPDPTVGFAEGQFYLITQQSTDYRSPGPWVEGVEARAGVDIDGNGSIDEWTIWETLSEGYDYTPDFIRVVTLTPAQLDLSALPAGYGFKFEFKIDDTVVSNVSPIIDAVEMTFEASNFQQWANAAATAAVPEGDNNANGIPNLVEFILGQSSLPIRQSNGSFTLPMVTEAIDDGYTASLWFSSDLSVWHEATLISEGVKLIETMINPSGDLDTLYEIFAPNDSSVFWKMHFLATD